MKKMFLGAGVFVALIFFAGCLKSKDQGFSQQCNYDSCALKAPASEIQAVQQYLADSSLTATQHCSGLFYRIESEGTGVRPTPCSYISVRYKGKLANGTVFDKSADGAVFSQYLGNLIRGWVNGLPYIKEGGKIHLYIPPTLGYGSQGNSTIPANSMLVFEVELVDVQG